MSWMRVIGLAFMIFLVTGTGGGAQIPPPSVIPPTPQFNPSTPQIVPQPPPVRVSPAPPAPGTLGQTPDTLAGTNQVVNPHRSVFHGHAYRHRYHRH